MPEILLDPNEAPYELLVSPENFRLAWERVRYFDRPDSRDWIGMKVFAANRDYNLELLRQSVIERTFEPSRPEIKYIPKSSMTLRPMAVLPVGDRIVYQAIANVIAEKARATLAMVADRQSYANVLAKRGSKLFFEPWKQQYGLFQDQFTKLVGEGNVWLAETDLAAFYETIDHSALFTSLSERAFLDADSQEYIEAYLPVWSSIRPGRHVARGIPQGCLASDLLANVFLADLDQELAVEEFHYLRYVDDIRVLAREKEAVQRGLICIDTTLKAMGLLLQTKKTTVRQILDIDIEVDRLAAQLSELDRRYNEPRPDELAAPDPLLEPSLHDLALMGGEFRASKDIAAAPTVQESLVALFWQAKAAIDSDHNDPFAERHLRFCLYRLEPDPEIIQAVLPLFVDRPWLSEIIALYLCRCDLDRSTVERLCEIIRTHRVYDSVVTSAVDILVRQQVPLRSQHSLLRSWLTNDNRDWPLLCVAATALGESSESMSVLLKAAGSASYFVKRMAMIQALRLARNEDEALHVFRIFAKERSPVVIDALLYQLYNEWGKTLRDLRFPDSVLPDYCKAVARGYDSTLPEIQPDYIRSVFSGRYDVEFSGATDFHRFLGAEYSRASRFLWQAENSYLVNPSRYVSQLDLFHEELLYPILVDRLKWKATRADLALVSLPDRAKQCLTNGVPLSSFGSAVLECHDLRSSCTESHTRLHRQLATTIPISWRQRDQLKKRLRGAYQELVDWLS